LIALIANARCRGRRTDDGRRKTHESVLRCPASESAVRTASAEKTSFASNASGSQSGQAWPTTEMLLPDDRERRTEDGRIRRPPSVVLNSGSTECVSSSRCQITENGGRRTEDG